MKFTVFTILGMLAVGEGSISVTNTPVFNPQVLVDALLGSTGILTSNAALIGDSRCAGLFSQVGIEGFPSAGVLLASGLASSAEGPNNSGGISNFLGTPGDGDLDGLLTGGFQTRDACVLSFDFECPPDLANANGGFCNLFFNYVFGSEEYLEYVGSSFNDVFGFFLEGDNIALIPGTSVPVSINTVNNVDNSEFLIVNENPAQFDIQADAFTTTLSVQAQAAPGMNTIKLGVADVGDSALNSWVFLEGGTFDFTPPTPVPAGGDPHFKRWAQPKRDTFHGECDIVLFHSEELEDGVGIDIHVRTTMMDDSWSYIEAVALGLGDSTLEFDKNHIIHNGHFVADPKTSFVVDEKYKVTRKDEQDKIFYRVQLDSTTAVLLRFSKMFATVNMEATATRFMKSSGGILGDFRTGSMVGRAGNVFDNFFDFAMEWQVNPEDPQLFQVARAPQLPYQRCNIPSASARRLRRGNRKLMEAAEDACAIYGDDKLACIDDVMLTGDLSMAEDFSGSW